MSFSVSCGRPGRFDSGPPDQALTGKTRPTRVSALGQGGTRVFTHCRLQQQIDTAGEHMQAVDHVHRDLGVQTVHVLRVALNDQAVLVGVHRFDDFQFFQLVEHVQQFGTDLDGVRSDSFSRGKRSATRSRQARRT